MAQSQFDRQNGILIRGASHEWTSDALKEAFAGFGSIIDVFIKKKPGGGRTQRGFAFITFADRASVVAALAGGPVFIGNSEEAFEVEAREERKHRVADASENIYIKGIGAETTEDQVREVVARFGSVVSIDVSNERGFAFIGYETVDEAAAAVASQPLDIDGASVTIEFRLHRPSRRRGGKGKNVRKRAERRRQARDPNSVYLKGVPVECDEAMIQGALAQFGTCVTVSHRARSNYAFAAFDSPEAMDAAIAGGVCSLGGKDVIIEIRNTGSE